MAMIRCLSVQQQQTGIKMVYMAPTKSLCAEKFKDWSQSFGPLGLKCQEFTGDSDYATINAIKNSDIIVTTPEKWDAMTRRWNNHKTLISMVKLIMIDEIHILKENRGAILEVCVSRMKYMDHNMRFVAVSATVPNLGDITAWLGASALTFSEEYRPIKLDRFVYGYPLKGGNYYAFEKSLDWKLLDIITKHSENKPVLIFCSTRGAAQSACETLLKHMKQKNMTPSDSPPVNVGLKNKKLSGLVLQGIGFHHAGLDIGDRRMVEKLFLDRQIRIVATTSTLAIGVNLPAHLVIIKSTKGYHNGALEEYSDIDILQMIGRSGRLGLDTSGCAVIMTTTDMESKLKSLVSCQTTIESSLHQNLTEHLMSEVCIGTIMDLESSVKWLKSTFLFIRVKQNPVYYQLLCSNDSLANNPTDQIMNDICLKDMKLLKDHHLVTSCDTGLNSKLQATFYGTTMDRFYIKFKTMISIIKPKNWNSIKDVLELVSQATEFEPYRYNANEKSALNFLRSKPDIRFPLKSKVSSISDKVFIIIQCVLGDISLYNSLLGNTLTSASHAIIEKASRITKCIIECAAYEKNSIKLKHSLDLYQCLKAKMWSNSPFILKQIEDIGIQTVKTLSQKNISTFQQLRDCDPCQLELILHRNPPFGTKIKNHLSSFPNYYLDLQQKPCQTPPQEQPTIELTVTVGLLTPLKKLGSSYGKGSQTVLWIETSDHVLIDFRRIWTQHLIKRHSQLVFPVQVTSSSMMISCHVQSEDYVGLDSIKEIKPDVDPMQFITLTKQWTEPQAPTSLEAQHDIAMEAQQVTTDFLSNVEDWMVETSDTVTIKAESPESPWTKPTLPTLPKEKPCKHQCANTNAANVVLIMQVDIKPQWTPKTLTKTRTPIFSTTTMTWIQTTNATISA
ncbi:Sec63 Brl domain-containing protein [Chlamydoabsidia padenii]|nr:Sec63 Brl domain-containing protein [Chlamydoabsidia padenii]